jgi:hypothetical protein
MLAALENDIDYCLDILNISKDDDEAKTKIRKLYSQNIAFLGTCRKRLVTLKIMADFLYLKSNVLSLSQLYDFLMLSAPPDISAEALEGNKSMNIASDIIFTLYKDLMENYRTANDNLKINYPRIVVDIIAILDNGVDTNGRQVPSYRVYDYYLSRKSEQLSNTARINILNTISDTEKDKTEYGINNNNNNSDLIQSLVRITERNSKEIEESLISLNKLDIDRIRNLCVNYPKIDKYCRLVSYNRKDFIDEIERERGGKKLTKYQLQMAVISITKVRSYIENVLDRKFVNHSSHYVNHTKHNLEYGYQIMGLIKSSNKG